MSFGSSMVSVEELPAVQCPRNRQRRNGLAYIFSGVDISAMKSKGWGEYSEQNYSDEDGMDSDSSESDTDSSKTDTRNDIFQQSTNIPNKRSNELSPPLFEEAELKKPCRCLSWQTQNCSCQGGGSAVRLSRRFSVDDVCTMLRSLQYRRRRNASPHVLHAISDLQLRNLKDMFVSTVYQNSQQTVCF